jgi:23S rRNA (pseudouridine1915-N3)-methyltransferase
MLNCLLSVGKPKKNFWRQALDEYAVRLKAFGGCQLQFARSSREEPGCKREELLEREGRSLLNFLQTGDKVWALTLQGDYLSSEQWAVRLEGVRHHRRLLLVVGGQLGMPIAVRQRADLLVSLGPVTLPHELAAVVGLEQLYRAHSILAGLPYHRGGRPEGGVTGRRLC